MKTVILTLLFIIVGGYTSFTLSVNFLWYLESCEVGMPFWEYREMRLEKERQQTEQRIRKYKESLHRDAAEWRETQDCETDPLPPDPAW